MLQAYMKQTRVAIPWAGSLFPQQPELPGWTWAGQGLGLAGWAASGFAGARVEGASAPPVLLDSVSEVCPLKSGVQLPARLDASQAKATEMGRHREKLRGDIGKECEAAWPFGAPAPAFVFYTELSMCSFPHLCLLVPVTPCPRLTHLLRPPRGMRWTRALLIKAPMRLCHCITLCAPGDAAPIPEAAARGLAGRWLGVSPSCRVTWGKRSRDIKAI